MSESIGSLEILSAALNRVADALLLNAGQIPSDTSAEKTQKSTADAGTTADSAKKSGSTTKTTRNKKVEEKSEPVRSKQETLDAIVAVKNAISADVAKQLLKKHGFEKLADIKPEKFDELYDDATALIEEQSEQPEPEDEEI